MLVYQCYQIGRFLKVLWDTFMFKSHPNVWRLFGLIWKASLFSNNCYGYLFSNVLISFGYSLFQHLVTLLVLNIYLNWLALSIITHLPTYLPKVHYYLLSTSSRSWRVRTGSKRWPTPSPALTHSSSLEDACLRTSLWKSLTRPRDGSTGSCSSFTDTLG